MANQYDVLGKAPGLEDLNKLSPNDVHLTIRGLNAGYGNCLLYTSPSPRDSSPSRMPSSA